MFGLPGQAPVTLTPAAAAHVRKLMEKAAGESAGLRIGVKKGGCAGMEYTMDFAPAAEPHDEVVEQCSRVFAQYDSQIHDQNSCDFNGNAIKDWGDSAPTTEPNTNTPPSGGANGSCKGNPNASNSQLCGSLNWTCSDQNWADVTRECGRRLTWGCCWDGGTQCAKADLLTDADSVFDAYYQQQSPNEPNSQHCDFGGSGMLVFN